MQCNCFNLLIIIVKLSTPYEPPSCTYLLVHHTILLLRYSVANISVHFQLLPPIRFKVATLTVKVGPRPTFSIAVECPHDFTGIVPGFGAVFLLVLLQMIRQFRGDPGVGGTEGTLVVRAGNIFRQRISVLVGKFNRIQKSPKKG